MANDKKRRKLNDSEATPTTNGTATVEPLKKISTSIIPIPTPKSKSAIPLPTPKSHTPIIPVISAANQKTSKEKTPKLAPPIGKSNSPIPIPVPIDKKSSENSRKPKPLIAKSTSPIPIPTFLTTNAASTPKAAQDETISKHKKKRKQEKENKERSEEDSSAQKDQLINTPAKVQANSTIVLPIVETSKPSDKSVETHKESKHKTKRKNKDTGEEPVESQSQTVIDSQSTVLVETPKKSKKKKRIATDATTNGVIQPILDVLQIPENTQNTGLHILEVEMYLPVSPIALGYALDGAIANSISPLLLTYHDPFKGYVLGHRNGRASAGKDAAARCIDQYGPPYLWVTVEILVFRPIKGAWLTGSVGMQTQSHINLVVWNYFNAKIERKRLPSSWEFIEDEYEQYEYEEPMEKDPSAVHTYNPNKKYRRTTGSYVDGQGTKIQGQIVFRAIDFDISTTGVGNQSIINIDGTFLSERDERLLVERETQKSDAVTMVNRPHPGAGAASSSRS
jgi:DNA-directed RNA polymerase I subunit RPA43